MTQGQDDRPDHRDEQNQSRHLKREQVARIENVAERPGIGERNTAGRGQRGGLARDGRADRPAANDEEELGQQDQPDQRADRQISHEAAAQLQKVDVEHHHDEEKQDRDRADIDDDQDHRQELGADQHEQAGGVEEGEDQKQHGVHRVARRNDQHPGRDGYRGEDVEQDRLDDHRGARPLRPANPHLTPGPSPPPSAERESDASIASPPWGEGGAHRASDGEGEVVQP